VSAGLIDTIRAGDAEDRETGSAAGRLPHPAENSRVAAANPAARRSKGLRIVAEFLSGAVRLTRAVART